MRFLLLLADASLSSRALYTTGQKLIHIVGGLNSPVRFIMSKWTDPEAPMMALVLDENDVAITVLMSELHPANGAS